MSGVRFVTPQLNLTKLMGEPGGLSAKDPLAQAGANLQAIRPT